MSFFLVDFFRLRGLFGKIRTVHQINPTFYKVDSISHQSSRGLRGVNLDIFGQRSILSRMSLDHVWETREPTDEIIGKRETTAEKAFALIVDALTLLVSKIEAGGDEAEQLKTVVRGAQKSIEALTDTSKQLTSMVGSKENFTLGCYRLIHELEEDGEYVDKAIVAAARALSEFEQLETQVQAKRANQQIESARSMHERMRIRERLDSRTIALTDDDKLEVYLQLLKNTIQGQDIT